MTKRDSSQTLQHALRAHIRDIPDFPTTGILFKDLTPVLLDGPLFCQSTDAMAEPFAGARVTHVVGIESRGFILGAPVAQRLRAGFVPVRKRGKLPAAVERVEYALEYGVDALEVHRDALGVGHRVLVVDDVLATGGTAEAACEAVERLGAKVVGVSFLLALSALSGLSRLAARRVSVLVTY